MTTQVRYLLTMLQYLQFELNASRLSTVVRQSVQLLKHPPYRTAPYCRPVLSLLYVAIGRWQTPFLRFLTPCEDPPAQQQETRAFYATSYSYQQRSEAGGQTHGQTYGASHNRASRSSSSADPWQSSTLDVPGGRRQGPSYHQPRPTTSRSSYSVQRSHVWSVSSPYPPAANPAYPTGHRSYRGDDPAATNTHYQRPLETSHASLDPISNSQGNAQLPYGRDPSTLSSVPVGVLPETSGQSIKNRETHNTQDDYTSSSPTDETSEEHSEIGYGAKLNIPGFGAWSVHPFVFTMYNF